jgi:hypothetical protein
VRWWSEKKNSPGARSTQDALKKLFQFDMEHGTGMFWGIKTISDEYTEKVSSRRVREIQLRKTL